MQKRKPLRLKTYDYSRPGAYFVTVCVHGRECSLGEVIGSRMVLNPLGVIVERCWNDLPAHYMDIQLDDFVVMPNHVHGILLLGHKPARAGLRPAPTPLGEILRAFKSFSSRRINESRETISKPFWQRNYYEHVVRDEEDLSRIREYIENNPLQWSLDEENPDYISTRT